MNTSTQNTASAPTGSWTKAQPGSIAENGREIWFRHQALLELASGSSAQVITSIRLSPPTHPSAHELSLDVIKAAVRQLRFDHPSVASWSVQPPTSDRAIFAYEVPGSEREIDAWLSTVVLDKSNFLSASNGDLGKAIEAITYDLGKSASNKDPPFLFHYIAPASPDGQHGLVFLFNHGVFDAVGSFQIMDLCVSRIADALGKGGERGVLSWGEESSRLQPALIESARIPCTSEKIPEDEAMVSKVKDAIRLTTNVHRVPIPHPGVQTPASTGLVIRTVSPGVLTPLHTAARAHGCTIGSFIWAAMVLSCVRIWAPDDTTNLSIPFLYSPVNTRSLACNDVNDRSQWTARLSLGFNSYFARDLGRFVHSSSEDDSHQLAKDVWVLAKEFREQADEQKKYMERICVWLDEYWAAIGEGTMALMADPTATSTGWTPVLSSIGVTDKYLARSHPIATGGELIVSSPRLSPCFPAAFGEGCLALHAFTWGGELVLPFTFPEGVMGSEQEQALALKEGRKREATGLMFVEEFMHIVDVCSKSK